MSPALGELSRIEASMARAAGSSRRRVDVGPLAVFLSDLTGWVHSLAIPTDETDDWREPAAQMVDVFDRADRIPRIEYFEELHPRLGSTLVDAGLDLDMRAPVMIGSGPPERPPSADIERLTADDDRLEAFVANQDLAYGGDGSDRSWLGPLRAGLAGGTTTGVLAIDDGEVVAGATLAWSDDIAELAGVWVLPRHRRRGLALAVSAAALSEAPPTIWLSAGPGTGTLYERLGFSRIGTQLNYIRR